MNIIFYVIGGLFAYAFFQKTKNNATVSDLNKVVGGTNDTVNSAGGVINSNYSNGEVDIFGASRPDRFNMGEYLDTGNPQKYTTYRIKSLYNKTIFVAPQWKDSMESYDNDVNHYDVNDTWYYFKRGISDTANPQNGGKVFDVSRNQTVYISDYIDTDYQKITTNVNGQWDKYQAMLAASNWGKNKVAIDRLNNWKNNPEAVYSKAGDDANHPNDANQVGTIISNGKEASLLTVGLTGSQGNVDPFTLDVSIGSNNVGNVHDFAIANYLKYNLGQYVLTAQTGSTYIQKAIAIIKGYTIVSPTVDKSLTGDSKNYGLPITGTVSNNTSTFTNSASSNTAKIS